MRAIVRPSAACGRCGGALPGKRTERLPGPALRGMPSAVYGSRDQAIDGVSRQQDPCLRESLNVPCAGLYKFDGAEIQCRTPEAARSIRYIGIGHLTSF